MRRALICLAAVLLLAGCASVPTAATPSGRRFAFVRGGNLWLWESGQERPLTDGGGAMDPRFSPDGRFVAYRQERALRVMALARSVSWRLPAGDIYRWSPTANTLAIGNGKATYTVAVTGEGPGKPRLVAEGWTDPVWSRDGEQLAVSRWEPGRGHPLEGVARVGIVPRQGGQPRVIYEQPYGLSGQGCGGAASPASWSADGRWLLLIRHGVTASVAADCNEFSVLSAAGGKPVKVGESPNTAWAVWDPSAPVLVFTDGAGRSAWFNKRLRTVAPPWTTPSPPLTPAGMADREPAMHPRGRYIAFTRSRAENPPNMNAPGPGQAIYQMDLVHPQASLVAGSEGGFGPFWTGDGVLHWFKAETDGATLYEGQFPLVRGLDMTFSYYGQWPAVRVLDHWAPPGTK